MKYIISLFIMTSLFMSTCNHDKTELVEENKLVKQITQQEAVKTFGAVEVLKPGFTKKYPIKGMQSETISKIIKVKDNDTLIYSEDTGHGKPTIPAGEGNKFYAISEIKYKDLAMFMLQDGRFITSNPKSIEIIRSNDEKHFYPKYEMHEDDQKYLERLNKKDPDYKAYEKYTKNFGQTQFDSKRELLMHTAIHQVNGKNEGRFVIEEALFQSFEAFKHKKSKS